MLAGQIACLKELAIFLAPNVNSYKRYAAGPGRRRRSPGGTTTGRAASGSSARPGSADGDTDPRRRRESLSGVRGDIAAGLYGIEHGLELPPALEGNAYESDADRFPHSLREAIAASRAARWRARASATR